MQKVFRSALRELVSKRFFYTDYKPPLEALGDKPLSFKSPPKIYYNPLQRCISPRLISDSLRYSSI